MQNMPFLSSDWGRAQIFKYLYKDDVPYQAKARLQSFICDIFGYMQGVEGNMWERQVTHSEKGIQGTNRTTRIK